MNFSSDFSNSEEYQSFRSSVALKKLSVDSDSTKIWKIYDAGPRDVSSPIIFLGPASGTADIFYKQMLYLTARGIRVISVEAPVYWSVADWCDGFKKLLDFLDIDHVHLFGASLGGFLAQKFAEYSFQYSRVASIILCNTFMDTSIFTFNETATLFWLLPGPVLKKLIFGNIHADPLKDLSQAQSVDFISERIDMLGQQELASRLTLNCVNEKVDASKLKKIKMTIIDVFDESALSQNARESLRSHYKEHAKLAHLKSGGNFPYLSRSDEVNVHILVHLRQFSGSRYSALKSSTEEAQTFNLPSTDSGESNIIVEQTNQDNSLEAELGTEAS